MILIKDYELYPKLMVRTPAYSYQIFGKPLQEIMNDGYFRTAIFLASKSLYGVLKKKSFHVVLLTEKEKSSVKMYLNRMCFRPTPFGLFSGFSVINWQSNNCEKPCDTVRKIHVQLDNLFLANVTGDHNNSLAEKYKINNSIYLVGQEFRYLRYRDEPGKLKRKFFIDCLEASAFTKPIIAFFDHLRTKADFVAFLADRFKIDEAESESFLGELIENQVILPEFSFNNTGKAYYQRLLQQQYPGSPQKLGLVEIGRIVEGLNNQTPSEIAEAIITADGKLRNFSKDLNLDPLYINLENTGDSPELPGNVPAKIRDGLYCLDRLTSACSIFSLSKFVSDFGKKFDRRSVPLLIAMDPEAGIGYEPFARGEDQQDFLNDVSFKNSAPVEDKLEWSEAHALILDKWQNSPLPKEGFTTVFLDEEDVEPLPCSSEEAPPAPSTSVLFRKAGDLIFIEQAGGVSATTLIGRFSPFNAEVRKAICDIARIEEAANPDVIFADITHVTDPRMMNIERHDPAREFEIPILTDADLPEKNQIPLSDLWLSIHENEIILWSRKLGKRIIPRFTSAFNYLRSELPVFRFLCDLQFYGIRADFTLDLTLFFPNLSFYPRVQYKDTIVSLASWHLTRNEINLLIRDEGRNEKVSRLMSFAGKMKWPRYISVNRHDNYIVIDSHKEEDLLLLADMLKKDGKAVIKEFPFIEEKGLIPEAASAKPFVQQFIAHLYHRKGIYSPLAAFPQTSRKDNVTRRFDPGSNWLYFKIYCHPSRSDAILLNTIAPFCALNVEKGVIYQWFFVRYSDPSYHLRIRIHLDPCSSGTIMVALSDKLEPLILQGIVSDFQIAAYERELERYDPEIIEEIEKSFCAGSELVTAILRSDFEDLDRNFGWYETVFFTLELLLNSFSLKCEQKEALFHELFQNLKWEFEPVGLLNQLQRKFRELRNGHGILNADRVGKQEGPLFLKFKNSYSEIALATKDWPAKRQTRLAADLIHMHLNRLFSDDHRKNELVVYYCLWKHFQSERGRKKKLLSESLTAY